jgi:hypothetical protein
MASVVAVMFVSQGGQGPVARRTARRVGLNFTRRAGLTTPRIVLGPAKPKGSAGSNTESAWWVMNTIDRMATFLSMLLTTQVRPALAK